MILQALTRYYEVLAREKKKVSRKGWCTAKVSYAVNLSKEGENKKYFLSERREYKRKEKDYCAKGYARNRSGNGSQVFYDVSANFLCDNAKYFAGN